MVPHPAEINMGRKREHRIRDTSPRNINEHIIPVKIIQSERYAQETGMRPSAFSLVCQVKPVDFGNTYAKVHDPFSGVFVIVINPARAVPSYIRICEADIGVFPFLGSVNINQKSYAVCTNVKPIPGAQLRAQNNGVYGCISDYDYFLFCLASL